MDNCMSESFIVGLAQAGFFSYFNFPFFCRISRVFVIEFLSQFKFVELFYVSFYIEMQYT